MGIYEKLRDLIPTLADDGSKEAAQQWLDIIGSASEMDALRQNPAFRKLLDQMRGDFTTRVLQLVAKDPELSAMRLMFVRTLGLKGAEEQISKSIASLVE